MRTLDPGVLAHVDAGETGLTERLLHEAGVTYRFGSVDDGSTRTDSLALERRRGITVKAAAVSFALGETTVNLIDTPGRPRAPAPLPHHRTGRARAFPVYFGSAITGEGVEGLIEGVRRLLPAAEADADGPVSVTVFEVGRGPAGEKTAYARLHSGTIRVRDRLPFGDGEEGRVTAASVFDQGADLCCQPVATGRIAKLRGLGRGSATRSSPRPLPHRTIRAAHAGERRRPLPSR